MTDVERIIVVRTDNIGDLLCSTPAIRALRAHFKHCYIAMLASAHSADAVKSNPDLDEIFVFHKFKHGKYPNRLVAWYNQLRVIRQLRSRKFDLGIGLRPCFSSAEAWMVYATGARYRLGCSPVKPRHRKFSFFYNIFARDTGKAHHVEKTLGVVGAIGVSPVETGLVFDVTEPDLSEAQDFLDAHDKRNSRLAGIHVSSRRYGPKEAGWGAENFAALADSVAEELDAYVLLTWAPGDEEEAARVEGICRHKPLLCPTPSLGRLAALQKHCMFFVAPDGGAMHLSTAVGVPTVAMFGSTDPVTWGPWGEKGIALGGSGDVREIKVSDVMKAARSLLTT